MMTCGGGSGTWGWLAGPDSSGWVLALDQGWGQTEAGAQGG